MSLLTKECNLLFYYTATAVHEIDRRSMNGHGATLLTYWATALHEEVAPADSEWLGAALQPLHIHFIFLPDFIQNPSSIFTDKYPILIKCFRRCFSTYNFSCIGIYIISNHSSMNQIDRVLRLLYQRQIPEPHLKI